MNTQTPVAEAPQQNADIHARLGRSYDAGFITDIESDSLPPGLNEDIIRALSAKKEEPEWMTEWRLAAYRHWLTMPMPEWAKLHIAPIDFQALSSVLRRPDLRLRFPQLLAAEPAQSPIK